MQWSAGPGGGFTDPDAAAWLPIGEVTSGNVDTQRSDPDSTLNLCRDLIRLRRAEPDLRHGGYEPLNSPDGTWAWQRGERILVVANLSPDRSRIECQGSVLISSAGRRRVEPRSSRTWTWILGRR